MTKIPENPSNLLPIEQAMGEIYNIRRDIFNSFHRYHFTHPLESILKEKQKHITESLTLLDSYLYKKGDIHDLSENYNMTILRDMFRSHPSKEINLYTFWADVLHRLEDPENKTLYTASHIQVEEFYNRLSSIHNSHEH